MEGVGRVGWGQWEFGTWQWVAAKRLPRGSGRGWAGWGTEQWVVGAGLGGWMGEEERVEAEIGKMMALGEASTTVACHLKGARIYGVWWEMFL